MIKLFKRNTIFGLLACAGMLTACSDSNESSENSNLGPLTPATDHFGKAVGNFSAEEWFPGGELGTTEKASYSAITPAAEQAGMEEDFNTGEDLLSISTPSTWLPARVWVLPGCATAV